MAGPTVGILIRNKLDATARIEIMQYIQVLADKVRGEDFWVNGAPLGYELGPAYPGEINEYSGIEASIGWSPQDIIGLYAMSNGELDHRVLAYVALDIARMVDGRIAFSDLLCHYTEDLEMLNDPGVCEYEHESVLTPDLLRRWLEHDDFRMVK